MNVVPIIKPPSKKEAQDIIRRFAEEGRIKFHKHCLSRKKLRNIATPQILNCLAKGYVDETPYLSPHHHGWETSVIGSSSGERLKIVVCLRFKDDLLTITCYKI